MVRTDCFEATILDSGVVVGGGTGYDNGKFYEYESGWWNQWFYNDPPDPMRWKWITYDIDLQPFDASTGAVVEVAINWSTLAWPEEDPPVPPVGIALQEEDLYIVREVIYLGEVRDPLHLTSDDLPNDMILIPDYNPEWVSIDIRVLDPIGMGEVLMVTGCIEHQCVPEPSTLALLGLGAIVLVFVRRSR